MAVEGFSRVPQGQAGTGEAFILGESRALDTYVQQEQAQIAAKKKAEEEALARKMPEVGRVWEEYMQKNMFDPYRDEMLALQQAGGDVTSPEMKRKYDRIVDAARMTKSYTGALDEMYKKTPEQLWGGDSKYMDKGIMIQNKMKKLTDENGNPIDVMNVEIGDIENIYDPDAFLTDVYMDDAVTNIKDQFTDQKTGLVMQGYGEYIQTDGKKIRFIDGYDTEGNPIAGVNDNVAQLILQNPTYSKVKEKQANSEIERFIAEEVANGTDEKKARQMGMMKKRDIMMQLTKDDVLAYQQVATEADMKLGINRKAEQTKAYNADTNRMNAKTNAKREERAGRKQELELESNTTTRASIVPTKIKSVNGTTANLGAFGSIGIPTNNIAKKDGDDGVKAGEAIPRSFSLNTVYNISSGGTTTNGTQLRVQGKESQAGTFSPIEGDFNQKRYQPQSIKRILVNEKGELVDIAWIGNKSESQLAQVAQENGLQLLEAAEMKDMESGDIIYTPMEGNPERQNIYNYFNTDYERANKALGEVEGVSRYEKLDAQGTIDRETQPKKSSNFTWGSSSGSQNSNIKTDSNGLVE